MRVWCKVGSVYLAGVVRYLGSLAGRGQADEGIGVYTERWYPWDSMCMVNS